jgi:putative RecB family exonuclease
MESNLIAPTYLSPSSMSTYRQCPQKFKFNKIDLIPDPSNHWAVLGNFVHDVLEEFYKLEPQLRTIFSARAIAKDMWESKWSEETSKVIFTEKEIKEFRWSAWWCIENLWRLENPETISPVGIEYELNGEVAGVMLRGFIDRYTYSNGTTMLTVSDYKTGKTPKLDVEEKFLQLLIYAKLLSSLGVGDVDKIELLYLKDGIKLEKKVTDKDFKRVVEYIQESKNMVDESCASGFFEARKSYLCNFCSYKKICPAWSGTK